MSGLWAKLNLKHQREIAVLNSPDSFAAELGALGRIRVHRRISGVKELAFVLAFVVTKVELDKVAAAVVSNASGDALLWFAYPKGTSTKYKCEFNRDNGWDILWKSGFDTVRQVAIDQDWSALRFRRIEFINHRAGK
ncbi:MAG: hypothetical protein ABSH33_24780 [Steroidobacteraceae bacterium]|jgi:hypothetical protein